MNSFKKSQDGRNQRKSAVGSNATLNTTNNTSRRSSQRSSRLSQNSSFMRQKNSSAMSTHSDIDGDDERSLYNDKKLSGYENPMFDDDNVEAMSLKSFRSTRSKTSQKQNDDAVSVFSYQSSIKTQSMNGGINSKKLSTSRSRLHSPDMNNTHDVKTEEDHQQRKNAIIPSYKTKNNIKSVLIKTSKGENTDVNVLYNRNRRYDAAGKYRIGPSFITKSRLAYVDEHKPAKLAISPDPQSKSLEVGLLTYLWTFTDQHDKQEIDLAFLQSLIDSGVNINCRDEHGQTILHAIVRDWHTDVALFAIRNNADVNAQDKMGRSPLHLAAALNCAETARVLLLNGANVELTTKNENQTAMHYASKFNSLETMKMLIRFQASITQRDSKDRTVLFLAADSGSTETAQFLLDIGAPVGVYDSQGYSLISHLLEKMPHIGYRALHQLIQTNSSLKRSEMYLNYLENNTKIGKSVAAISKSPLEIITIYDDVDLIMHPVIQKAVEVKWKLFGRNDTIRKLFITFLYLICWLVLAYTFSDKKEREYYKPYSTNAWKILPEALIIIFALYFFYHDLTLKKDALKFHRAWVEWRQHSVRANYSNCHPTWPGDRETLESETERIRGVPSLAGKQKFWFIYEWMILLVLAAIIVTRIIDMTVESSVMFLVHKCVFGFGLAVGSFIQTIFLYVQFFVPFVAAFWLIFGHDDDGDKIPEKERTLDRIFFNVYVSSMGQDSLRFFSAQEEVIAQVLISLFHVLVTFITFAVFVALITSKFTTHHKQCVAQASLLQASVVLQLEKNLSKRDKLKLANYYTQFANPMIVQTEKFSEGHKISTVSSRLKAAERRLAGIENVIHETEDKYSRNDRRSQNTLLENIINSTTIIGEKQESFASTLKTNLDDIKQRQEYMNKYLPKLLKQQQDGVK